MGLLEDLFDGKVVFGTPQQAKAKAEVEAATLAEQLARVARREIETQEKIKNEAKAEIFNTRFRKSNERKLLFGLLGTISVVGLGLVLIDRFVINKPLVQKRGRIE